MVGWSQWSRTRYPEYPRRSNPSPRCRGRWGSGCWDRTRRRSSWHDQIHFLVSLFLSLSLSLSLSFSISFSHSHSTSFFLLLSPSLSLFVFHAHSRLARTELADRAVITRCVRLPESDKSTQPVRTRVANGACDAYARTTEQYACEGNWRSTVDRRVTTGNHFTWLSYTLLRRRSRPHTADVHPTPSTTDARNFRLARVNARRMLRHQLIRRLVYGALANERKRPLGPILYRQSGNTRMG